MKSLVTLHLTALHDAELLCGADAKRDVETLTSRWEHEGDSFLTITLPTFAKALERGLREGVWPRQDMTSFSHVRGLPAFMQGFLTRVFHPDGTLLDVPDANSIWAIRQVCNLTGKIERDCAPFRRDAALRSFVQTDEELGAFFLENSGEMDWTSFDKQVLSLFGTMFDAIETKVSRFDIVPSHGPGAVAEKANRSQRQDLRYWPERLNEVFPQEFFRGHAFLPMSRDLVPRDQELPVRVVTVPKTMKTPRVIAIEPSAMQFAQQALKREFDEAVHQSYLKDVIDSHDQTRNQELARLGSIDGSLATLDLSEASDRVHIDVVRRLFRRWPHLLDFVEASRSLEANVEGTVIRLNKFASMGSALTFPVETMIFLIMATMEAGNSRAIKPRDLRGRVSVYGDDIIVPVARSIDVVRNLESFGFKVNKHKSFWTGQFRESCGAEYYNGNDVSVIRLRADLPKSRQDAALLGRLTDFRNRCFRGGLWRTVKSVDDTLAGIIRLPEVNLSESLTLPLPALRKETSLPVRFDATWHPDLHRWVSRAPYVRNVSDSSLNPGEGGLLEWFFTKERQKRPDLNFPFKGQERAHASHIKWAGVERLPKLLDFTRADS